jgi:hypothetical protein
MLEKIYTNVKKFFCKKEKEITLDEQLQIMLNPTDYLGIVINVSSNLKLINVPYFNHYFKVVEEYKYLALQIYFIRSLATSNEIVESEEKEFLLMIEDMDIGFAITEVRNSIPELDDELQVLVEHYLLTINILTQCINR